MTRDTDFKNQLPDIPDSEIIITLREEGDEIALYFKDKLLAREAKYFEYYPTYLTFGELLKEKYGDRLVDFEADYTVHLGGDSITAFDKVRTFRKSLRKLDDISDSEFDFITRSGQFDGNSKFNKTSDFVKKRLAETRDDIAVRRYNKCMLDVIDILRQTRNVSDYVFTVAALYIFF